MKYSEVKKIYKEAWNYYLDPCFDGKDVARLMIEIIQLKAALVENSIQICPMCGCEEE